MGDPNAFDSLTEELLGIVYKTLCREYGVFDIGKANPRGRADHCVDVYNFILTEDETERVLDAVELLAKAVTGPCRNPNFQHYSRPNIDPDEALSELNSRFKEHGVGYQFEAGEIIRVDSQLLHSEVVVARRFVAYTQLKLSTAYVKP